jgi:hypothetical protein
MTAPEQTVDRPDWRESFATAADLALVGVVAGLASLPVVTAGAALTGATVTVDSLARTRTLPAAGDLGRAALRGALPGLGALGVAGTAAALITVDLRLLAAGTIPGGPVAMAAIAAVAAVALSVAATTVVRVGQTGAGWVAGLRWSLRLLKARPLTVPATLATMAVPVALSLAVPVLAFVLPGFALYGLHAVVRRLAAGRPD